MEKQCVGIDVSKDHLDCCYGIIDSDQNTKFSKTKRFDNSKPGFVDLLKWVKSFKPDNSITYVMEATGVYYEHLVYFLSDKNKSCSVLLPNVVNHFRKSINIKTKTDNVDAEILSRIGLERKLETWQMPTKIMRDLRFLCREYRELKLKLNQMKNQLHAREHSYGCPSTTLKRLKRQIALVETQALEIEAEIRLLAMSDSHFYDRIQKVCTLPGVSFITVICILAETHAFALIRNGKQLASYAGLDVQHNQSGQKQGKSRISKKGNKFIRHALYMPSLCSSRFNPTMKEFYNNLCERKPAKKIGVTAVSRKLLILIYTLWKNETEFDPNFEENKKQTGLRLSTQDEHKVLLQIV